MRFLYKQLSYSLITVEFGDSLSPLEMSLPTVHLIITIQHKATPNYKITIEMPEMFFLVTFLEIANYFKFVQNN